MTGDVARLCLQVAASEASKVSGRINEIQVAIKAAHAGLSSLSAAAMEQEIHWAQGRLLQLKEDAFVTQQQAWELERRSAEQEEMIRAVEGRQQLLQEEERIRGSDAGTLGALKSLARTYEQHIQSLQTRVDTMTVENGEPSAEEEVAMLEHRVSELVKENQRLKIEHKEEVEKLDMTRRRQV